MKKIINLPLKGSIAFLLDDADMHILKFGISHEHKHVFALCDSCNSSIHKGSYIYVPVLNNILCQRCFDDWQKNGTLYEEDNKHQYSYALAVAYKLGYKFLADVPTIEYNNVDTDSDDKYANLSDKELKEIYDDMVADDEISRQKRIMTKEEFNRLDADEQMFIIDNHLEDESLETVRDLAEHWDEANYFGWV